MKKALKFLSSLKLAVVVILALASLIAVGTVIEARYDAEAAQKLIYKSIWMYATLITLAVNLTAVMVDRWPWKTRHIPFILAHIGILVLLTGAALTQKYGLDGNLRVEIGKKNRFVNTLATDFVVYSSFDGDKYTKLYEQEVDFFLKSPKKYPLSFPVDGQDLKILDYEPYTLPSRKIVNSVRPEAGAAVRFQVANERVNSSEWLFQRRKGEPVQVQLGLAFFHLGEEPKGAQGKNEIFLNPGKGNRLRYTLYYKDGKRRSRQGTLKEGEALATGWMGLELRVLRFFPQAEEEWEFKPVSRPTPLTTAAILLGFGGKQYWMQTDDVLKLFSEQAAYIVSYAHRRIDLGFDVLLKKFEVGRYQGTMRAASYQSVVEVPGFGEKLISMNEPLKYDGLTLYQASFEDGPEGAPVASIFSVNHDPGRWLKYLGSLIICLGVVWLFYDKRKASRAMAPRTVAEVVT